MSSLGMTRETWKLECNANRLGNPVHCIFLFTFLRICFLRLFFIRSNILKTYLKTRSLAKKKSRATVANEKSREVSSLAVDVEDRICKR